MNSFIIWSHLPTHLVFEFEVTPISFLIELFIDSIDEVVMVSKDMEIFSRTWNARYCSLLVAEHWNFLIAMIQLLLKTFQHNGEDNISVEILFDLLYWALNV